VCSSDLKQLEKIIESYKVNAKKLEAQINLKANELKSVKAKVDQLKAQEKGVKMKIDFKCKFLSTLKESKMVISNKLQGLNDSISGIQKRIRSISLKDRKQDKIGAVIAEDIIRIGEKSYTKVNNALKAQEEKMSLLEYKIFTLQEYYTELAEKNVMERYASDNLREKVKELEEKYEAYENAIKEQEKIITNQREEKLKAIRMYQNARKALSNISIAIKKKIHFLSNNLVKCIIERTDLISLFYLINKLHESIRQSKETVVESNKQIAKKNKDLEQVKVEKAQVIEKSKLIPKLLKRSLAVLIKDKINKKCNELKGNLNNALLEQEGKVSSLSIIMEELFDKYGDSRSSIISLKVKLQNLQSVCSELKNENMNLTHELSLNANKSSTAKDNKIILLEKKFQEAVKSIEAKLINSIETQYKHIDLIKNEIREVRKVKNKRQEENTLLKLEIKKLEEQLKNEQTLKQSTIEQLRTNEVSKKQHIANLFKEVIHNTTESFNNSIEKLRNKLYKLEDIVMNLSHRYIELNNALTIEERGIDSVNDLLERTITKINNKVNVVSNSLNELKTKVTFLLPVVRNRLKEKDDKIEKGISGSNELISIIQEKIEKKNDELNVATIKIQTLNNIIEHLKTAIHRIEDYHIKYLGDIKRLKDNTANAVSSLLDSLVNVKKKVNELNEKFKEVRNMNYNIARNEIELLEDERNAAINEVFELKSKLSHLEDMKSKEQVGSVEDEQEAKELTERSIEKSDREIKECSSSQEHSEERGSPLHFAMVTKDIQGELSNYENYIQEAIEEVKYNQNEMTNVITSCRNIISYYKREKLGGKELEFNLTVDELKSKLEDVELANKQLEQQLSLAKNECTSLEAINIKLKRELEDTRKANEELSTKLVQLQEKEEQRSIELEEIKSGTQSLNLDYKSPRLTETDRNSKDLALIIESFEQSKSATGEHIRKLIIQCVEAVPSGYFW
jgi:chromosome segregation ATPase